MIVSASTEIYNNMFQTQYRSLVKFARGDTDNVHNSYIKTLNRLNESTFTAHTQTELQEKLKIYSKTVIANNWKTSKTLQKNNIEVGWEAEEKLNQSDKYCEDEKLYYDELEFYTMKLFEYLKKNHSPEDNCVFRVYYLYDKNNKKITYKQL